MKTWIQRVRGALGMGITWAVGWAPVGAVTGGITATLLGFPVGVVATNYAVMFGVLGLVGGVLFSSVLRLTEGRRAFHQLSLGRFALWGALGGLLLGGLALGVGLLGSGAGSALGAVIVGAATLLGSGSAAGTLAIARAGDERGRLEPVGRGELGALHSGAERG